jgi:hypothetical protein
LGNAQVSILFLLFFFMSEKDFGGVSIAVCGLVSVCDTNIENCRLTFGPKAMNRKVSSEFGGWNGAVGPSYRHVSTRLDEWFV